MALSETHRPAAFGHATPLVRSVGRALFVTLILALAAYLAAIAWELNSGATGGAALHIDFVAFWAAAKLALAGEAVSAFDPQALVAAQSLAPDGAWGTYFWHYPPGFHLLITPLGLLGFSAAFAVFSAVAIGLYILALSGWARPVPGGLGLAVAAPPVAFVLVTGNASLLWVAALLSALSLLARKRPRGAGAMIALLTLKPQLGLLIPVALIAGRHWRALLWAAAVTAAIAAVTTAVFGVGYWAEFFRAMARATGRFEVHGANAVTMITWYAFARLFGAGHETALALQMLSLAAAAGAVGLLWSRRGIAMDLKIAALCLATLISTPYAYQYELVLAVAGALFLARAGLGHSPAGRAWLAALWLLPVPGWLIGGLEIAHYAAPALSLSAAACTVLALRRPDPASAQASVQG
jgi:hypothetical protein